VATRVGQVLKLHCKACIAPVANIITLALMQVSAPKAKTLAI